MQMKMKNITLNSPIQKGKYNKGEKYDAIKGQK